MLYKSTRNSQLRLEASQVIAQGISEEGGLFVPECFPDLSSELPDLAKLDYPTLAKTVFSKFLTDFTEEEIGTCVDRAYSPEKFGGPCPVKLQALPRMGEDKCLLELWHGPTSAFKDMALQMLPQLLSAALRKRGELDGIPELGQFADALEGATLDTIRSGVMTGDLALLWEGEEPAQKVSSIAFLKEIRNHLEAKLS